MSLGTGVSIAIVCVVVGLGCGARTQEPPLDSQSHWLAECTTDAECGGLTCVCGLCTRSCENDAMCWEAAGSMQVRCDDVSTEACDGLPAQSTLCVPDCPDGNCVTSSDAVSDSDGDTESITETLSGRLVAAEAFEVPQCPEVAPTVGAPPFSVLESPEAYSGVATVAGVESEQVTLTLNELPGESVVLRSPWGVVQELLSPGLRVRLEVLAGGESNGEYGFAAVFEEAGPLLFAVQQGADTLYQRAEFSTTSRFGATLELRMICQEQTDGGCFENQVQATYAGIFRADSEVTTDGTSEAQLTIDGQFYSLVFSSGSVDGGAPTSEACAKLTPGRYVHFTLSRQR